MSVVVVFEFDGWVHADFAVEVAVVEPVDVLDGREFSSNADLVRLLKLQESNKHDGTTAEQVLKFFAYKNARDDFNGAVTQFLNSFAARASEQFSYATKRRTFETAARFLIEATHGPFLRQNTNITPLFQFEACLVALGEMAEAGESPVVPADGWLEDPDLVGASRTGSNTRSMLRKRINRAKELFGGRVETD